MPELPEVNEAFTADVQDYLDRIQEMIDQTVEATAAVANLRREIEELPRETTVMVNYVRNTTGEAPEDVQRTVSDVVDVTNNGGEDLQKAGEQAQQAQEDFEEMSESAGEATEHLEEVGSQAQQVREDFEEMTESAGDVTEQMTDLSEESERAREEINEIQENIGNLKETLDDTGDAFEDGAEDTRDYAAANREAEESVKELIENALASEEGFEAFRDALEEAVPGVKAAIAADELAGKSLRELGESADLATLANAAFTKATEDSDLSVTQQAALLRAALAAYKELGDAAGIAAVGEYALDQSMDATNLKVNEQAALLRVATAAQRAYASTAKDVAATQVAEEDAFTALTDSVVDARDETESFGTGLADASNTLRETRAAAISAEEATDILANALQDASDASGDTAVQVNILRAALRSIGPSTDDSAEQLGILRSLMQNLFQEGIPQFEKALARYNSQAKNVVAAGAAEEDAFRDLTESVVNARDETESFGTGLADASDALQRNRAAVVSAQEATDILTNALQEASEASGNTAAQANILQSALRSIGPSTSDSAEQLGVLRSLMESLFQDGIPEFEKALAGYNEQMQEAKQAEADLAEGIGRVTATSDAYLEGIHAVAEGQQQAAAATDLLREAEIAATAEGLKLDAAQAMMAGDAEALRSATGELAGIWATLSAAEDDAAEKGALLDSVFMLQEGMMSKVHGLWSLLTVEIQLFGGAMTKIGAPAILSVVSGWHLMLDAIIETAGTLIPAAIAFGAFGIAAIGPVETLYKHLSDVDTVSKALGADIPPLTGGFSALGNAVKPEVYVLFGEALVDMSRSTGEFAQLAKSAGNVLDGLGARFVVATTEGGGFSTFVKTATSDLSGWGTVIGNIGGIIGNILKILPGFAEMFLAMAVAVTHFLEVMTGVLGPVLELAIAMHGVILYGGLAATVVVLFGARLVALGAALLTGTESMIMFGLSLVATAADEGILAAATEALEAVSPVGWVALAIGALVALGIAIAHWGGQTSEATQQAKDFGTAMQNAVSGSGIEDFSSTLSTAMANTQRRLSDVNTQIAAVTESMSHMSGDTDAATDRLNGDYNPALAAAGNQLRNLRAEQAAYQSDLQQLQGYQSNYNNLLKQLDPITGSATASLNGLSEAGVTSQDVMNASKGQIAEYVVEVEGYDEAVRAATDSTGRYAAAQNALAYENGEAANQLGTIDAAMEKVTEAQSDLVDVITGGETSLITFSQGLQTIASDAKASGASMNGLSANSLQLQSDFYSGVTSLQAMIGATEEQGASTKTLTAIVATGAGELLGYAGKNVAAEASIASLINDALGPGTVSLQNMNSWVKQNSTSQQGLAADIATTTTNASKLSQTLSGDLNAMMAQSITDAYGGQKAFDAFATGVLNGNTNSASFKSSAKDVVEMLEQQSGDSLPKAQAAFVSYAENGLGLSKTDADNLWKDINENLTPAIDNLKGTTDQAKTSTGTFGTALNTAQGAAQTLLNSGFTPLTSGAKTTKGAVDDTSDSLDPLFTGSAGEATDKGSTLKSLLDPGLTGASTQAGASASNLANSHLGPLTSAVKNVNTWVGTTTKSLNDMPKSETTNVHVKGSGGASISSSIAGIAKAIISIAGFAGGGVVPGYSPGHDTVAAMLSPGEGILTPQATKALGGAQGIASINKNYQHFAGGGVALPDISGAATAIVHDGASIITQSFQTDLNDATQEIAKKTQAAQNAMTTIGSLSASAKAVESLMISMAAAEGWTGSQLTALLDVENREAGFNPNAKNPTSDAYGLAQFIDGPSEYAQYGGSSSSVAGQITAMFNYIKCLSLDSQILTRDGWKTHDEVRAGDETIGYDLETGEARWTRVTAVHHYESAPVTRMHNGRVSIRSTPNHRWVAEKRIQAGTSKPDYYRQEMTETAKLGTRHRIRLAARVIQDEGLPITVPEAELLGWIAGDGEAYRRDMHGKGGNCAEVRVFQSEAKPAHLTAVRELVAGLPHSEYVVQPKGWARKPIHHFRLSSPYAHDLLMRSGYEGSLETMVLRMSTDQREAFMKGLLGADGHKPAKGNWMLVQNEGPVLDAAILAATLLGNFCHLADSAGQKHVVVQAGPYVKGGLDARHQEECEPEPVWCVTTESGTWMARQDGQLFLTGNSRYGSPSGAWASEVSKGYYDQGGWLQPGWTMALNNTGQPEKVTSPTGSGPGEGGMVHAVFQIDGKSVFEGIQPYALQYNSRNRGNGNIGAAGFAPNR